MRKDEKLRRFLQSISTADILACWSFPPVLLVPHLILFLSNSEKCGSASLLLIKNLALFRATTVTGSKESRRLMVKSLVKSQDS